MTYKVVEYEPGRWVKIIENGNCNGHYHSNEYRAAQCTNLHRVYGDGYEEDVEEEYLRDG